MSHVLNSEMGMSVARLMLFVEDNGQLKVQVRWGGLRNTKDTLEQLQIIYKVVRQMLLRFLNCKNTPANLAKRLAVPLTFERRSLTYSTRLEPCQ